MPADEPTMPPLPEHPALAEVARMVEALGMVAEILDHRFRSVFATSEASRIMGIGPEEAAGLSGMSAITRTFDDRYADVVRLTEESGAAWARHNVPIIRHYVQPGDADFEEVFGDVASYAAAVEPVSDPPRAWSDVVAFPQHLRFRRAILGDQRHGHLRISDDDGRFLGVLWLYRSTVGDTLLARLGRGDRAHFERMERVSEPARRPAGILFVDLEASGALSRRLSSRGYFDLIRDLTDLLDSTVIACGGIAGKHAGDGGSALFLAADFDGSESGAARATVEAARAIREGADALGPDDVSAVLNLGLHWGSTLMVGQVATGGRLEVTALGDQMNQCARIESAATGGAVLASKDLVERLGPADAETAGIDPDRVVYTTLGELPGASEKARRDAGEIPVTPL